MRDYPILDIAGVGAGPFNLSIAALTETRLRGLTTRFFEKRPRAVWHPGLLLPDTHLQTGFLKDLVTPVAPESPYSFINYLVQHRRFYRFLNAELGTVSRAEFTDYLDWVKRRASNVSRGNGVREIQLARHGFQVRTDSGDYQAHNLCLGGGKTPWLPDCAREHEGPRCFHASEIANTRRDFRRCRVVLVGNGQSGADVFLNALRGHWGQPRSLQWVSRRRNFEPLDETAFTNEYFTPDYASRFHTLTESVRQREVAAQKLASDGITPDCLQTLYRELYHRFDVLGEPRWARLLPNRIATAVRRSQGDLALETNHGLTGGTECFDADVIIWATGFSSKLPACVDPLKDRMTFNNAGEPELGAQFQIRWDGPAEHQIYALNAGRQTHGIAEPQFSLMAWRSAVILNHVVGRAIFDVGDSDGPIDWQPVQAQTWQQAI